MYVLVVSNKGFQNCSLFGGFSFFMLQEEQEEQEVVIAEIPVEYFGFIFKIIIIFFLFVSFGISF